MKTAYELLMEAPDDQVVRCKIAFREIAAGNWGEASFTLTAASNESNGQWAADAAELAAHCGNQEAICCSQITNNAGEKS